MYICVDFGNINAKNRLKYKIFQEVYKIHAVPSLISNVKVINIIYVICD